MKWESELRFAHGLADIADEISMRYFRRTDTTIRSKADGTPVTQADEEIERLLRKQIASAFPDHGVLGEEEGESEGTSGARWIVDPIDGTKSFSWGIPIWATLIALEVSGEIVCGIASAPALRERFGAARGSGAMRNGEPIRTSDVDDLSRARIGFTSATAFAKCGSGDQFQRLLAATAHNRGIGDFYGHMLVACGSLDVMVEPVLHPWDLAAVIVIVEEAGGRLSDLEGRPHIYGGGAVTSNGRLHDAVLAFFRP